MAGGSSGSVGEGEGRQPAARRAGRTAARTSRGAIDKDYVFEGPDGKVGFIELFEGRSQLIVYHFMWLHDIDDGCPSCSFAVDNMPDPIHLNEGADTTLVLVSRAPYERLSQFKARMGWHLPWYSSHRSDFNYDFHVSSDESITPIEYNYKDKATLEREGLAYVAANGADGQGISVFVQRRRQGLSHVFGLRCGRRCHAEHLPVPGPDPAGPPALHQRMAVARHVRGTRWP